MLPVFVPLAWKTIGSRVTSSMKSFHALEVELTICASGPPCPL